MDDRGARKRVRVGIAALRADPALVDRECRAVGDRGLGSPPPLVRVDPEIGERQQPRARVQDELGEIGRPLAAHGGARLADLERVPDGGAERLIHVRQQADDLAAGAPAELEHRLGEHARVLERLHEGAVADLDVEHDRVRPARELLGHDRRRDQRHDVDRRGHVAEAVELLVGRDEIGGLADDREPDVAHLLDELVDA